MKRRINALVTIDLVFLFLLAAAGSAADELIGNVIYYLAFILPISIGLIYARGFDGELRENGEDTSSDIPAPGISISKRGAILTLPIIAPTIVLVCIISYLTALLISALGYSNNFIPDGSFLSSVLMHALIPAVLEELLFRYIPLRILKTSKKGAVIISSALFAFAHTSLFQIPYALVAGIILASVTVATGSILPSLIIHFINNFISLAFTYGMGGHILPLIGLSLAAISLTIIIIFRNHYLDEIRKIFTSEKIKVERSLTIFGALSLFLAITALIL